MTTKKEGFFYGIVISATIKGLVHITNHVKAGSDERAGKSLTSERHL
jgi:hypothetical protein